MSSAQPQPDKPTPLNGAAVFNSFSANIGLYSTAAQPSKSYSVSVNTSIFIKNAWGRKDPAGYQDGLNLYAAYFDVNGVDPLGLRDEYVHGDIGNHAGYTNDGKLVGDYWTVAPTRIPLGFGHLLMGGIAKSKPMKKGFMENVVKELNTQAKANLVWMEPVHDGLNEGVLLFFSGGGSLTYRFVLTGYGKAQLRDGLIGLGSYVGTTKIAGQLGYGNGELTLGGMAGSFFGGKKGGMKGVLAYALLSQGLDKSVIVDVLKDGEISRDELGNITSLEDLVVVQIIRI